MKSVLFLCTGNSARSVLAESILQKDGAGRFRAFSAGSQPKGKVNPYALRVLEKLGYPYRGFRSKTWDEFAAPKAPHIDLIITVCDNAAGETCPIWPGKPIAAHWGIEDPAAAEGTDAEIEAAFMEAFRLMKLRVDALLELPSEALELSTLRKIGMLEGATAYEKK